MRHIKYPAYYNIDGLPAVLKVNGMDVIGMTANGKPYSIGKVLTIGYQISKREYDQLAKDLYGIDIVEKPLRGGDAE